MGRLIEKKGNLITLARQDEFDVIIHGCNCFCKMGAGIAPQMAKEFGANRFKLESWHTRGDYNKLGQIDYEQLELKIVQGIDGRLKRRWRPYNLGFSAVGSPIANVIVVNAYTQYGFEEGDKPNLDYTALKLVMQKVNHDFKGKHIGLPWIGAGLAGGDWNVIKNIILGELVDCDVTLVEFSK